MGKRLYIGNLNYRTTEDVLEEVFSEYGSVVETTIIEGKLYRKDDVIIQVF